VTESRQHPRTIVESQIAFQVGDGPRIEATCRNISLGGMHIETDQPQPYGKTIRLFMQLPGMKNEVMVEAVVRWSKPDGMGIQFGRMGALETHALTQMIGPGQRAQRPTPVRRGSSPALDGFPSGPTSQKPSKQRPPQQ